ncbi:MAG: MBL fold metallo-hydrolase [Lentimicrobiaceae bacterium]|jgi:phosphoribosyl 1,2-cyclic phosphodiesterase|nr:MBL fold metallo-hydrolase [Lentimicrobiaceae bacterium]
MDLFTPLYPFTFCSFASGSSGNCFFVGSGDEAILIDVGISTSRIEKSVADIGFSMKQIKAVFLTHDHIDHTKGIATLVKKYRIPVYARETCRDGVLKNPQTKKVDANFFYSIDLQKQNEIASLRIEAFEVPHDGNGSVGYHICFCNQRLTIVTDLGHINDHVATYLNACDTLIIESNYDKKMLETGPYPHRLKRRIDSQFGHLCNDETASFLAKNYKNSLKHIFLCHISACNNTPDQVLQTIRHNFEQQNCKLAQHTQVVALPREKRSDLYYL